MEKGNSLLIDVGQSRLINYTVAFLDSNGIPFGTSVLVIHNEKRYFFTTAHVAEKIGQKGI